MDLEFSIVIPVYNRPDEIDELLKSLSQQTYQEKFEIIIVDDGSSLKSEECIKKYQDQLDIAYFYKANSGPGLTRNFAMQKASGNYFIILDSDCILPEHYLDEVSKSLLNNYTDAFGGPDTAHESFSILQKAINFTMTAVLTTGGIRGKKSAHNKFQPRSFNMGMSKLAFESTKGFGSQHFGEDIDLTFRLWENGFETQLLEKAYVYHKRRISFKSFYKQTFNFGAARPILNKQHPKSAKITYWFPSVFLIGLIGAIVLLFLGIEIPLLLFGIYFLLIVISALIQSKSLIVAIYSIFTTITQFLGYGLGFLRSFIKLHLFNMTTEQTFPEMFS